ncbi:MAG: site-specific DNA-methyltransferase [Anaerofustis sp.]
MSTNISKEKRDNLINKIKAIRTYIAEAPQDENTGALLVYLSELEKEVKSKKYGLVFEEHREEIDEILAENVPVLTEEPDLFINNGGQMNFLIEGDNLASLQLLLKTHRGKIDLIYIDPPYNTLKEGFTYSDLLVDKNDTFRHSKWCSFMLRRLELAKNLLSDLGVIFISIDDNEVGALRLLCDQIFGYQNFIANVIWEKKFSPQNDAKWLSDSHDHILVYAKNKERWHPNLLSRTETMDKRYSNPDNDPRGVWASSDFTVKTASEAYMYPITTPSGRVVIPTASRSWVTSQENYEALKKDNRIWFGAKGNNVPRIKTFLSEVQQGTVCKTIWYRAEVGDTQEGTRDLKSVFGKAGMFTNPKPIRLIERILDISLKSKNATILDFFAGSGTTAHAVMKLNAEDGGNRRFIVCTNNENSICREVTYERIRRVIDRDKYNESLKYYCVDFVSQKDEDGNPIFYYDYAPELLKHVRELVELENGVNFNDNAENAIVLTDEEADAFFENTDLLNLCKRLYVGHDVLLTGEQEEMLKSLEVELIVIPDYYYKGLEG